MPANEQITEDYIKLDQFLKLVGAVDTGGQAKLVIQEEEVSVNGQIETRRGRKLVQGDIVKYQGQEVTVELAGDAWQ